MMPTKGKQAVPGLLLGSVTAEGGGGGGSFCTDVGGLCGTGVHASLMSHQPAFTYRSILWPSARMRRLRDLEIGSRSAKYL